MRFHVLLTTYEMMVAEGAELRKIEWEALVVDEAHRLRNSTSRCFTVCKQVASWGDNLKIQLVQWGTLIVDEAHRLRNSTQVHARVCRCDDARD